MYYVYIIQSEKYENRLYKGFTTDLNKRLFYHNSGKNISTNRCKPWKIIFYAVFRIETRARKFEKYLKSSSGIAFMRKRLI
jgi:putative endonuclease